MAPKKRKASGKKKKKGRKSAPSSAKKAEKPIPIGDRPVDEVTRQFYLVQIRDLDERLQRYKKKCDSLEVENMDLIERLRKEERDRLENSLLLKKEILQKEEECANIHEEMAYLQHERSVEKDSFEQQLATLRAQAADSRETFNREITYLKEELQKLDHYRQHKEEHEAKMLRLEAQLQKQSDHYKRQMEDLDRTSLLKQDRLKKDMLKKVTAVSTEFRRVSEQQMATTTKYTIEENVGLSRTLKSLETTVAASLEENKQLRQKCDKQKRELELVQSTYNEAVKRKVQSEQFAKGLTEMLRMKEEELESVQLQLGHMNELKELATEAEEEYEVMKKELDKAKSIMVELEHELSTTREELSDCAQQYNESCRVLSKLATSILYKLHPHQLRDRDIPEGEFLESMFSVLRAATDAGILIDELAPDMSVNPLAGPTKQLGETAFTQASGKSLTGRLPPIRDRLPHSQVPGLTFPYAPGDLGILPRVALTPHSSPKTTFKETSPREEKRSSSTQTVNIPKALLLADRVLVTHSVAAPARQSKLPSMLNSRTALTESSHNLQRHLSGHELRLVESIQKNALLRSPVG